MKKYLSIIAGLMLCICFIFSGCSKKLELPTGDVYSNGGSVVMVGDYVYFANTYVDYKNLSGNDNTGDTKHDSLFRVKTDQYGFTTKNEDDHIENVEKVYSKISGFSNSHMFVVGNYIYFTSPNTHKENKTGVDKFDLTTLFRMKLDGTNLKEILTTETIQGKFYLVTEQNPYLLIFDNNQISKLEIKDKLSAPKVIVSDVLDTVFPTNYGQLDYVYYTTDIEEHDKESGVEGNYLYKLNLETEQSTKLGKSATDLITLVALENNNLYYKLPDGSGVSPYYSSPLINGFYADQTRWTILGQEGETDSISQFTIINQENVVYKTESKIYLSTKGEGELANYTILVDEDANIELVDGDYVYYSTANGLYRISYRDKVVQTVAEQKNIQTGACDIAGEYIYFFAKLDTNTTDTYYCFRASTRTPGLTNPEAKFELIANVQEADLTGSEE